jgi:hypothetical protein
MRKIIILEFSLRPFSLVIIKILRTGRKHLHKRDKLSARQGPESTVQREAVNSKSINREREKRLFSMTLSAFDHSGNQLGERSTPRPDGALAGDPQAFALTEPFRKELLTLLHMLGSGRRRDQVQETLLRLAPAGDIPGPGIAARLAV